MKVTFLGTSAANANPEAFCRCANCTRARELGGPSLRKRSAVLVNDDLLIDLGPDVQTASRTYFVKCQVVKQDRLRRQRSDRTWFTISCRGAKQSSAS